MDIAENGNNIVQQISDNNQQLAIYGFIFYQNLNNYKNLVQSFTAFVEKIGSAEDTELMRNSMCELIEQSNSLSKTTGLLMQKLVKGSSTNVFKILKFKIKNFF